jgi:GR25 family glycosyltransferase involved in LPS biosynthesis
MDNLSWEDLLGSHVYIVNMDRCPDRLQLSVERCEKAGFTNINRFRGVDAKIDDLEAAWKKHGFPKFDETDTEFVLEYPGKQGCALSHYGIWKDMIDKDAPYAIVFEDDIEFHKDWDALAPQFWENTPRDFDILYFGSQLDMPINGNVVVAPVFCTHAYLITLQGAKTLYDLCLNDPNGTRTIDCMIIDHMKRTFLSYGLHHPFVWYVWSAEGFPDSAACKLKGWEKRNTGLVFQDADLGTFVRPW